MTYETLVEFPKLFTCPIEEVTWRFCYLGKLMRAQLDPTLPLYVPPSALYECDDEKFCLKYAKTSLEDYKFYLRSI